MPGLRHVLKIGVLAISLAITVTLCVVHACPYCPPTDATLSERLAESDAACVVKFLESKTGEELSQETTTFEVLFSLPKKNMTFAKGKKIVTSYGQTANIGDQFLLMGQLKEGEMEWALPIPLDELGHELNYILKAPVPERPADERLTYFLRYLDHPTPLISNDAFGEFARSKFEDVEALSTKIDRLKVREWLEDPNPQLVVRRAFYGMLLGLCGNENDADYLEQRVCAPIDPAINRIGIEGLMAGYLMLRGERALNILIEKKINSLPIDLAIDDPRTVDLNALRITLSFLWDYRPRQFSKNILRAQLRRYLDRPDFAELAIVDLARWKDWESIDQLIRDYGKDPWETRMAKEKVINFALVCVKYGSASSDQKEVQQAVKAAKFLEGLDPRLVNLVKQNMVAPKPPGIPDAPAPPNPDDKRSSLNLILIPNLFAIAGGLVVWIRQRRRLAID